MYRQCRKSSLAAADCAAVTAFAEIPRVSTNYFHIEGVDDGELLIQTYRVRYQVYCLERGFLDPQGYPERLEMDSFDAHATHMLARHKAGQTAGTARLVRYSAAGFPLQRHCLFDDAFAYLRTPASPVLQTYSEISRLAISKLFRRRVDDSYFGGEPRGAREPAPPPGPLISPTACPEIVTGLFKYLYHESKRLGITHWLVAMERSLDIMLRRMGFTFTPVGPEVDYYGPTRPFIAEIAELERTVPRRHPQMLAYMIDGLPARLRPDWPRCDGS